MSIYINPLSKFDLEGSIQKISYQDDPEKLIWDRYEFEELLDYFESSQPGDPFKDQLPGDVAKKFRNWIIQYDGEGHSQKA